LRALSSKLETENQSLMKSLASVKAERKKFREKNIKSQKELQKSVEMSKDLVEKKTKLEISFDAMQGDHAKLQAVYDDARRELTHAASRISDLERRAGNFMNREEEQEKMKKALEKGLLDAREVNEELKIKYEESIRKHAKFVVKISELESTSKELAGECEEFKKEKKILHKTLAKVKEERIQFETMYKELGVKSTHSALLISKLEKRIEKFKGLEKQCKDLEIEKGLLKKSLQNIEASEKKFQSMCENARRKSESSAAQILKLESNVHEKVKKCEELEKVKTGLERTLRNIRENCKKLQIQNDGRKKQADMQAQKLRSKIEELCSSENRCVELEKMKKNLSEDCARYEDLYKVVQDELSQSKLQITKLNGTILELGSIKNDCEKLTKDKENLEKKLGEAQGDYGDLKIMYEDLQRESGAKLQCINVEISRLSNEYDSLVDEKKSLEKILKESQVKCSELEKKEQTVNLILKDTQTRCEEFKNMYEDKQKETIQCKSKLDTKTEESLILTKKCQDLDGEIGKLNTKLKQTEEKSVSLQTMINEAKADKTETSLQISTLKNSIADIKRKYRKMKDDKKTQKKVLEDAQDKSATLQSMYQDKQRDYKRSVAQISTLRATVDELRGST